MPRPKAHGFLAVQNKFFETETTPCQGSQLKQNNYSCRNTVEEYPLQVNACPSLGVCALESVVVL